MCPRDALDSFCIRGYRRGDCKFDDGLVFRWRLDSQAVHISRDLAQGPRNQSDHRFERVAVRDVRYVHGSGSMAERPLAGRIARTLPLNVAHWAAPTHTHQCSIYQTSSGICGPLLRGVAREASDCWPRSTLAASSGWIVDNSSVTFQ